MYLSLGELAELDSILKKYNTQIDIYCKNSSTSKYYGRLTNIINKRTQSHHESEGFVLVDSKPLLSIIALIF